MPGTIVECAACGRRNRVRPHRTATPRCARCKAQLPWLVDADEASFGEEVAAPVPVLVDFWAPWCTPCRAVAPIVERMAARHAGRLKVVRVNVDEAPRLAAAHRAASIPTLALLRDGREVDRIVGALPSAQLEARVAPHLSA
jgi:thioredoxin 2